MKHYLLLRDNRQSGPYSYEELQSDGLYTDDLIWVEGISTSWQFAGDLEALQPFVQVKQVRPIITKARSASPAPDTFRTAPAIAHREPLKERLRQWEPRGPVFRKKLFKIGSGGRFVAVLAGLFLTAAMMKKMADTYAVAPEPSFSLPSLTATAVTNVAQQAAPKEKGGRIIKAETAKGSHKKEGNAHGAGGRRLISYQPTLIKLNGR